MRIPGLVLGYHGCDRDVAEAILAGKAEVRSSTNSYDWLGSGAYFWENNPARAFSWAKLLAQSKSLKIKTPAVIGAIIDPGNCLDLAEESSQELVKAAFEGGALFDGSKLSEKSHIQWCVRDPQRSVIGYFRPRNPKATEA